MLLQRILSLALLACAAASAAAYDFGDTAAATRAADDDDEGSVPNDEERIYGGTEADISKYPWTVSLRKTAEGTTYCGGTLVAPQYIVTAAHCVKNTTFASIGSQWSKGSEGGERIRVTDQWIHPKYVKETHVYDVAVMKLEKPSTYKTLPLAKADGSQNKENTMAVVRGWGMTESDVPATTLLEVNVKVISNAICNKSYNNRITEQMLCAGQGGGKDTCQGDSGGALIANNVLIGVVSWGGACGEAPGVYVRVTSVLDFINEKINGGSSDKNGSGSSGSSTPAATTAAPATTTAAPATTTAAPATTTATPATTTEAPATTTAAPATTTDAPATTTSPPTITTAAPTSTPALTTATPSLTPSTPSLTPSTPSLTPSTPSTTAPSSSDDSDDSEVPAAPSPNAASDASSPGSSKDSKGGKKSKKDCRARL